MSKKMRQAWQFWSRFIVILIGFFIAWIAAHFLLEGVSSWFNFRLSETIKSLVTFFVAIWIVMTSIWIMAYLMRNRRSQAFAPMIAAIKRIGRGELEPIRVEEGHEVGPFGELIESINTMADELTQMEKLRQEFISNVSHEFQSPLTSISGFARELRRGDLSEADRNRYLYIIERECSRLSRLSDNLLKLTSLESEHQPVRLATYRLDRQLRDTVLLVEPLWDEKKLDVELELEDLAVTADEELLSQVWTNLLHNSIKFTPPGGAIRVCSAADPEGGIRVTVSDTGVGMSEEQQLHIFDRFYKADHSRNREAGGSGLGLAIVKKIIELHGGTVSVTSSPGEGSTFTVVLRN